MNIFEFHDHSCTLPNSDVCGGLKDDCDHEFFSWAIDYYCNTNWTTWVKYKMGIIPMNILLFVAMGLIVSNYLFPNLHNIATRLKVNEKFLSFIILPLINSFPDMLNYYNTLESNSEQLILGQLIGSNLIILSLILGIISTFKPFSIKSSKMILVDFLWLFIILLVFTLILIDGQITRFEAIIMSIIYLIHLVYLFNIDRSIQVSDDEIIPLINIDSHLERQQDDDDTHWLLKPVHFLIHYINKFIMLFIPLNEEDFRFQNIWYFVISQLLIIRKFYQFNYISFLILINNSILFSVLIYFIHSIYITNFFGIVNSLLIISEVSLVVLKLLKNFGLIVKINEYLLGLFVFSISNSINDIIIDVSLSLKFTPFMGLNACLGTPLLLILVGVGYNSLLVNKFNLKFEISQDLLLTLISLIVLIGSLILIIPFNDWKIDKKIGIGLIGFWVIISGLNIIWV